MRPLDHAATTAQETGFLADLLKDKQERITFHRGANFTIRLVFNSFEGSTIREKSIKMYCAQEARLVDLYYSLAHSLLPDLIVG